jgi:pyridoxamine 5'-phosphate oxidase
MNQDNLIRSLRRDYQETPLTEENCGSDPFKLFQKWFEDACNLGLREPNSLALTTCNKESGQPSIRTVLLKQFSSEGLIFYTNYLSRKGREIELNPLVSALFFWVDLERQIRIEGTANKISPAASAEYFISRPRGTQIGAHCSPQSQVIANRAELENLLALKQQEFTELDQIPCPENWGGYIIVPNSFEFWQGRSNRLHDRIVFKLEIKTGNWKINRLAP